MKKAFSKYLIYGVLILLSAGLLFTGLFYNKMYMSISTDIVQDLYTGGDYSNYEAFIIGFINGGNLQPISKFYSYLLSISGIIILYIVSYLMVNKGDISKITSIFTLEYWSSFFLLKRKEIKINKDRLKEIQKNKAEAQKLKLKTILSEKGKELKKTDDNQEFLDKIRKK